MRQYSLAHLREHAVVRRYRFVSIKTQQTYRSLVRYIYRRSDLIVAALSVRNVRYVLIHFHRYRVESYLVLARCRAVRNSLLKRRGLFSLPREAARYLHLRFGFSDRHAEYLYLILIRNINSGLYRSRAYRSGAASRRAGVRRS